MGSDISNSSPNEIVNLALPLGPESFESRTLKIGMRLIFYRMNWGARVEYFLRKISKKAHIPSGKPPTSFFKNFNISRTLVNGHPNFVLEPAEGLKSGQVIFIHGGGFIGEIMQVQWNMVRLILEHLGCTVTVPIYPLIPQGNTLNVLEMLRQVYLDCQATAPGQKLILMGDSAGGNLALALAELLKQEQLPTPSSVVLLSPELDCTLSNPKIKSVQHLDPELSASDLLRCNEIYRGELPLTDWRVSPIYGDYSGVGPISIFTGTSDILNPDARQMAETSNQLQIPLSYYEYPNQIHDFMLLDLPESQIAKSQILVTLSEALN